MYYKLLPVKWHKETIYSTFDNQYYNNKILKDWKSFRAALTEPFKYKCIMNFYFSNFKCSFGLYILLQVVFKSSLVNLNWSYLLFSDGYFSCNWSENFEMIHENMFRNVKMGLKAHISLNTQSKINLWFVSSMFKLYIKQNF